MPKPRWALPVALALSLCACARPQSGPGGSGTAGGATVSGAGVVAEVNGGPILASELEQRAAGRLTRLKQEEYEIRREVLDEMIAERLVAGEAQKRGMTPEALLKQEVDGHTAPILQSQLETIYEQNKPRFGGLSRDEALARIRAILTERATGERRAQFEKELRTAARVAVRLSAPRAEVRVPAGAPAAGPESAPVTIVEFTDYQCPYCHRAQSVIDELLARYAGKVRLVHLDYPLDGHAEAVPAARAARCAGEQGRFWEYHRGLMSQPGPLDTAGLRARAAALGLRDDAFGSCLASDRHDAAIDAELRHGLELGVTGTPAYFINGRMVSGARPLEAFTELIDAELATAQGG